MYSNSCFLSSSSRNPSWAEQGSFRPSSVFWCFPCDYSGISYHHFRMTTRSFTPITCHMVSHLAFASQYKILGYQPQKIISNPITATMDVVLVTKTPWTADDTASFLYMICAFLEPHFFLEPSQRKLQNHQQSQMCNWSLPLSGSWSLS